ncbi:MAG: MarR family transcriptional regulator [Sarcina sp.]
MDSFTKDSLISFLQTYMESSEVYYKEHYDSMNINDLHTICEIYKEPGINSKKISNILSLTTGGVTKIVKRLEKKDYIESFKSEKNKKEVYFKVKEKGEKIGISHEKLHDEKFARLDEKLKDYSAKEHKTIQKFLSSVTEFYEDEMNFSEE